MALQVMKPIDLSRSFSNLGNALQDRRTLQAQEEEKKQNTLLRQQYATDVQLAFQDPTPNSIAGLIAKYPQQEKAFSKSFELASQGQKDAEIATTMQVYSALQSGNLDVAKKVLDTEIAANENSGINSTKLKKIRESVDINPKGVAGFAGLTLASLMGEEQFAKVAESLGKERRAEAEAPFNIKKIAAEVNKIGAETGLTKANINKAISETKKNEATINKTNAETNQVLMDTVKKKIELGKVRAGDIKLTTAGEKILNDATLSAINSNSLATQYDNLANEIETAVGATGTAGQATEIIKKIWGSPDTITKYKQEFTRLKNSAVLDMLPPGPATDKDIELAQKAFPDENSDPKFIASFMRGLAKLQKYDSQLNEVKADWVNGVGNLGRNKNTIVVKGEEVPKGTSFNDFVKEQIQTPNVTAGEPETVEQTPSTDIITTDQAQSMGITFN